MRSRSILITPEAAAIYAMDRGYVDFARLHALHQAGAFFVTRAKINLKYHRATSRPVDKSTGLGADQSIALDGFYTRRNDPEHLRRGHFCDPETGNRLPFIPNNFTLPALTIAALYKQRWQVGLFFKWIKRHLRIRHFSGSSGNAVKTQIGTAVCVYGLAAIIKKELGSMYPSPLFDRFYLSPLSKKSSFPAPFMTSTTITMIRCLRPS